MKITLRTDFYGNDIDRVCAYAHRLGVEHIFTFPMIDECYGQSGLMESVLLKAYTRKFSEEGLRLSMISEFVPDSCVESPSAAETAAQRLCTTLNAMGEAGVESLFTFIPVLRTVDERVNEERWSNLVAIYEMIVPCAENAGVRLSNHGHQTPDFLIFRYTDMKRLLDAVPSKANGATLCMGCYGLAGDDLVNLVHELGDRIVSVHARDFIREPDGAFTEVLFGTGEVDVVSIVRELHKAGFNGLICPEHIPKVSYDPNQESTIAWGIGYLTNCLTEVERERGRSSY